ncbi:Exodeoxyribonuclease I [Bertholletia excelsa]
MGIKDLLRFMKPHVEPIHIKKYAGKRVGIDAYSWLHKGAYSCSMEICLNTEGEKKFQYLKYFMHRINLLRHYNITPVVVFDGASIPCKAATENERTRHREANRDLAMAKLKEGNFRAASDLFQRAVNVTPSMAHQLIQVLRSENVDFVVAPYEADAQLAYLSSLESEKDGITAVISEDSDLLAYGCPAVIFKMDRYGNGEEIVLHKAFDSVTCVPSFQNFDMVLFTGMCVLAGCDFLPSVPGIGISKAYSLVSKYRNLDRALSVLKFEKGNIMPEDYSRSFREAVAVFQHALVYDTNCRSLKHLKPPSEKLLPSLGPNLDFLGPEVPKSIAIAIAEGNLNPCTMEAFHEFPLCAATHVNAAATIQTSDRPPRVEVRVISTTGEDSSCFSVIPSLNARKDRMIVMKQKADMEKEEPKYLQEAQALEKLLVPLKNQPSEEHQMLDKKIPLNFPDNNPFRKRNIDQVQSDSEVTEVENSEISCVSISVTPESQESVDSKPPLNVIQGKKRAKSQKVNGVVGRVQKIRRGVF